MTRIDVLWYLRHSDPADIVGEGYESDDYKGDAAKLKRNIIAWLEDESNCSLGDSCGHRTGWLLE